MKNGFSTFMNTEKESRKWHYGIYSGLKAGIKAHNPKRLRDIVTLFDKGKKKWYADDDHYHDIPAIVCFGVAFAVSKGIELWVIASVLQYLGVDLGTLSETLRVMR